MLGVTAPIIIAFHAAFKFRGIAGMAFWIMVAVALSGIVGRYLYAQIPRRLNAAEFTWQELQDEQLALTHQMAAQKIFPPGELVAAFHIPDVEMVKHKSAMGALLWMFALDLARPFRVAALRRQVLGFGGILLSLGGFCPAATSNSNAWCRPSGGRRRSRSAWCSCPAPNRCSSSGTSFTGHSAMPSSFWRSAHCDGDAAGLSLE